MDQGGQRGLESCSVDAPEVRLRVGVSLLGPWRQAAQGGIAAAGATGTACCPAEPGQGHGAAGNSRAKGKRRRQPGRSGNARGPSWQRRRDAKGHTAVLAAGSVEALVLRA